MPWTCLRVLKESNESSLVRQLQSSGTVVISHIAIRIVACMAHFLPTTFLEMAVYRIVICGRDCWCVPRGYTPCNDLLSKARPKGVPCSGFRYMKGKGFYLFKYIKG